MDLRGLLSPEQIERACDVLDYQPFLLTDDIQTGAAYSWVHAVNTRSGPPTLFRKNQDLNEWDKITDSNARLRRMYDDFVAAIAERYSGGSFLDVACNNGYFPVKAELLGMKDTFGADGGWHFEKAMLFLNEILGTNAKFIGALYDPRTHLAAIPGTYDVVSASAILCHLPDPLDFLAFLGTLANEAIFYFGQVVDSDVLMTTYLKPHPDLALSGVTMPFPYRFNDVTRVSRGLLYHSFEEMGFDDIVELPWKDEWLSPYFTAGQREPLLEGETRAEVQSAWQLHAELTGASKHVAVLAMRREGRAKNTAIGQLRAARECALFEGNTIDARRVSQFPPALELLPALSRHAFVYDDGTAVKVSATADIGHFLYGPYILLDPGGYRLELRCRSSKIREPSLPILTVEVVVGPVTVAAVDITSQGLRDVVEIDFQISQALRHSGGRVEFRLSHHGRADLEVSGVRLLVSPPKSL
jgi:SAM-dependent methyltransferase